MDPKQVFISYARADARDFAKQLSADLQQHGYGVWVDLQDIPEGALWEVRIEQGIREASVVTVVMTPSALREESVSRDETVFAFNEGKPIVPLRRDPQARPTLLLARRNWIDFSASYENGLKALLGYLADDHSGLRDPALLSVTGLRPLDFGPEIARYSLGFVGRAWLGQELDRWLADDRGRAFVIVGEPGIGKSAIAAWLCLDRREQVVGIHFCTHRSTRTLDPHEMVASLVAQLHASLPGFEAAVAGREPERRRDTAGDAFRELIIEPTRGLEETGQHLIIIDSLDEAELREGERVLDVLVAQASDLPPWLRLVTTTRPEGRVLDRIRRLSVFELSAERSENLDDVASFAWARLQAPGLAEKLGPQAGGVRHRLAQLAAGNFLYARLVLDDLAAGTLSVDDLGHFRSSDLAEFYGWDFARRFPDVEAYQQRYAPLLRALAAAQAPLSFAILRRVLEEEAEVVNTRLRALRSNLRVTGDGDDATYSLFHKSLQDWLQDRDAAGEYWLDLRRGHAQLADALADTWRDEDYALRYLPAHLTQAQCWDGLIGLLTQLDFLETKAEAGLSFDLAMDFARANEALPDGHAWSANLQLLEQALGSDLHFIARHPTTLFQCFWNSAWWYDCPEAANHYESPEGGWDLAGPPWERPEPRLSTLMERWHESKGQREPAFVWLRSLRPPPYRLGGGQRACLWGHTGSVKCVARAAGGAVIASGGADGTVRTWSVRAGNQLRCLAGHSDWVVGVAFTPCGSRAASVSHDGTACLWERGSVGAWERGSVGVGTRTSGFQPREADGKRLAAGSRSYDPVRSSVRYRCAPSRTPRPGPTSTAPGAWARPAPGP